MTIDRTGRPSKYQSAMATRPVLYRGTIAGLEDAEPDVLEESLTDACEQLARRLKLDPDECATRQISDELWRFYASHDALDRDADGDPTWMATIALEEPS